MRIEIKTDPGMPANMAGKAVVSFEDGDAAGLKLVEVCLWRGTKDPSEVFVSFPARKDKEGKWWDYIRGDANAIKAIKSAIVKAYRKREDQDVDAMSGSAVRTVPVEDEEAPF